MNKLKKLIVTVLGIILISGMTLSTVKADTEIPLNYLNETINIDSTTAGYLPSVSDTIYVYDALKDAGFSEAAAMGAVCATLDVMWGINFTYEDELGAKVGFAKFNKEALNRYASQFGQEWPNISKEVQIQYFVLSISDNTWMQNLDVSLNYATYYGYQNLALTVNDYKNITDTSVAAACFAANYYCTDVEPSTAYENFEARMQRLEGKVNLVNIYNALSRKGISLSDGQLVEILSIISEFLPDEDNIRNSGDDYAAYLLACACVKATEYSDNPADIRSIVFNGTDVSDTVVPSTEAYKYLYNALMFPADVTNVSYVPVDGKDGALKYISYSDKSENNLYFYDFAEQGSRVYKTALDSKLTSIEEQVFNLQNMQVSEIVYNYLADAVNYAFDDSHGYAAVAGQNTGNPGFDCGGFVTRCLRDVGILPSDVLYEPNDGSEYKLTNYGFTYFTVNSEADLKPGDVLYRYGHTEIYLGNGKTVGARNNYDGVSGDSSGNEVAIYDFANSSGWTGAFRYNG